MSHFRTLFPGLFYNYYFSFFFEIYLKKIEAVGKWVKKNLQSIICKKFSKNLVFLRTLGIYEKYVFLDTSPREIYSSLPFFTKIINSVWGGGDYLDPQR